MSLVFADNQIMVHAIDETGNKMKNGKKRSILIISERGGIYHI